MGNSLGVPAPGKNWYAWFAVRCPECKALLEKGDARAHEKWHEASQAASAPDATA